MLASCKVPPSVQLQDALREVQSYDSCEFHFKLFMKPAHMTGLVIEGDAIWIHPDLLMLQYDASGRGKIWGIATSKKAWIFHEVVRDWVDASEAGLDSIGKPIQNPGRFFRLFEGDIGSVTTEVD